MCDSWFWEKYSLSIELSATAWKKNWREWMMKTEAKSMWDSKQKQRWCFDRVPICSEILYKLWQEHRNALESLMQKHVAKVEELENKIRFISTTFTTLIETDICIVLCLIFSILRTEAFWLKRQQTKWWLIGCARIWQLTNRIFKQCRGSWIESIPKWNPSVRLGRHLMFKLL